MYVFCSEKLPITAHRELPGVHHGCLIKSDRKATGKTLPGWPQKRKSSADCAQACSVQKECETFLFDAQSKECHLKKESEGLSKEGSGESGWCPKESGKEKYIGILNVEECRLLCQLAKGCIFFRTDLSTGSCFLENGEHATSNYTLTFSIALAM